jgi:hypothetical protein
VLLQGPSTYLSNLAGDLVVSDGLLSALSQSLKVAGFATVLAALLETLLAKKQILSVERMLSEFNTEEPVRVIPSAKSLV